MDTPTLKRLTAAILVIGDEILSGRTKDRNIGTIADHLIGLGIDLKEVRIVPDEEAAIIEGLNALRGRWHYVFTTGGIGPTHDDITADSVAKAFGVPIAVDERAVAVMRPYAEARGFALNETRLRMARLPEGARLIHNSVSAAPGFMIGNVIVMAGVPNIMQAMLLDATQYLDRGAPVESRSIDVYRPEGDIADVLRAHALAYPAVSMGSYPQKSEDKWWTQLVLRSSEVGLLEEAAAGLKSKLAAAGFVER